MYSEEKINDQLTGTKKHSPTLTPPLKGRHQRKTVKERGVLRPRNFIKPFPYAHARTHVIYNTIHFRIWETDKDGAGVCPLFWVNIATI